MTLRARRWLVASTPRGEYGSPPRESDVEWRAATLPGTVGGVLGLPFGADDSIDHQDWWFRCVLDPAEATGDGELVLRLEGVATVWEAYIAGERVASGSSMFAPEVLALDEHLTCAAELVLCCRALGPLLQERRTPRARWRTKLAAANLRFFRTTLHGRMPGFSAGPPVVGPWRPVVLERRRVRELAVRSRLAGDSGVLTVAADVVGGAPGCELVLTGPSGVQSAPLDGHGHAKLVVEGVTPWWPHTHGDPVLYEMVLRRGDEVLSTRTVGFRGLESASEPLRNGIDLRINGVAVFARGALWSPVHAVDLAPSDDELRTALEQVRDAGMNMIRLPGTGVYESGAFHDLCDELGILVWQDLMFANFDYPIDDAGFRAQVQAELDHQLGAVAGRPSLAVVCGNSEVEQQAAMFGQDPALGRGPLFGEIVPAALAATGADAVYVPSAPCGEDLPMRPDRGVANYFGVGGYRRPLTDVRFASVRFASECLAIANVGDDDSAQGAGVPRDVGSEWDFADVRDHYLGTVYGEVPAALRERDPERYAALSRSVTGHVMAEVFGEWRRTGSPCCGGLVLALRDVLPGAGWGVIDVRGTPKVAYHHLRRALAPTAVWTTDEGLAGIDVHVANDGPEPLVARLRVALYRDFEHVVDEEVRDIAVEPHGMWTTPVEGVVGGFRDVSWAYRFGRPGQHAVVATLEGDSPARPLSQTFRYPVGMPSGRSNASDLGLEATLERTSEPVVKLRSRSLAWGVRPAVEGWICEDDAFDLEPGHERLLRLRPAAPDSAPPTSVRVSALNLEGDILAR